MWLRADFSGPFGASLVRREFESTINNNFNGIYLHIVINRAPRALTGSRALGNKGTRTLILVPKYTLWYNLDFLGPRQPSWRPSWILKKPSQWEVPTQPNVQLDIKIYPKMPKKYCKLTLQGSRGKWSSATRLLFLTGDLGALADGQREVRLRSKQTLS